MNEQWVRDNLGPIITDDLIQIDDYQVIPISNFVTMFQAVSIPGYDTLKVALPVESGWPATFDQWHNRGLI